METELLYWHWMVFGVLLLLLELVTLTFVMVWLGVAALLVGFLLLWLPAMALGWQLFGWALLSAALAYLWVRFIKPLSVDKTRAGLSREAIVGQVGQVLTLPVGDKRGTLRFTVPILGAEEWPFMCQHDVKMGDKVRVLDVVGNALSVTVVT